MSDTSLLHLESRFRLTGEVAGRQRTFLLVIGENRIGSLPANDIVLKAPGVSRNHAIVTVQTAAVRVVDLGSKNGTFVNGETIHEASLGPGDRLRIGSVALRLVEIEDDEAAMAFVVTHRPQEATEAPHEAETEVARPLVEHQGLWLELTERFLTALYQGGETALSGAFGHLVQGLGATSAVLCQWKPSQEPVVRAAWGQENTDGDGRFADHVAALASELGAEPYQFGFRDQPAPFAYGLLHDEGEVWILQLHGRFDYMDAAGSLLRAVLTAAATSCRERREPPRRHRRPESGLVFPDAHVIGASAKTVAMYRELETACRAAFPVLVLGETGVGKEHVAKILHLSSPRHQGPFVAINCAAIPAELLEAELFGIRGGVATGVAQRQGRFQMAEGGTLLLDEVGDMPLVLQAKLLRVLEEGEVAPVGGKPTPVDVRIVAATNANLLESVEAERFRRDFYYRLAGYVLQVPPLRERRDDIPLLVEHFLRQIAEESGRHVRGITLRALRVLSGHAWPGNVRELIHEVRRLVYGCHDGEAVDRPLLSEHILAALGGEVGEVGEEPDNLDIAEQTAALERRLIRLALERTEGNRSQAARILGISRQGLAMKIERLGLEEA